MFFFIIFDNIVHHCHTRKTPDVSVRIESRGDVVHILVENEIGPDVPTEQVHLKLESIRAAMEGGMYQRAITTEGGTGLHKIRKILEHDLGSAADLRFGFRDAKHFFVQIDFVKEGWL